MAGINGGIIGPSNSSNSGMFTLDELPRNKIAEAWSGYDVAAVVVGGGGSGGCSLDARSDASGGGAGGFVESILKFIPGTLYQIEVGAGGQGTSASGQQGKPSYIKDANSYHSFAIGGGGGYGAYGQASWGASAGGSSTANWGGQGNPGGISTNRGGPGGGGAGGAGHPGTDKGGAGGDGKSTNITGIPLMLAAGGGGAGRGTWVPNTGDFPSGADGGAGGSGIGGTGAGSNSGNNRVGSVPVANTGSGSGGAIGGSYSNDGGATTIHTMSRAGADGTVIISVPTSKLGLITGPHTTGVNGDHTWIRWTGNGTYKG